MEDVDEIRDEVRWFGMACHHEDDAERLENGNGSVSLHNIRNIRGLL